MDLITDSTASAIDPGVPSLTGGTRGYFVGATSGLATRVRYWFLNMIMKEMVNVVTTAGLTCDPTNHTQLMAALRVLFGGPGSLALPGYMQLPASLILQWNSSVTVTGEGDSVTFPIPFPSTCFGVLLSEQNANGWGLGTGGSPEPTIYGSNARSKTGFSVYGARVVGGSAGSASVWASSAGYSYFALGN